MTEVDFYVLADAASERREQLACRVTEKACELGHRVYINAEDTTQAERLDALLWTFRVEAFLPHDRIETNPEAPVVIATGTEPADLRYLLLNLAPSVPAFFSRFERVAEIINDDPAVRDAGRERFRFYRDRGYSLRTHKL